MMSMMKCRVSKMSSFIRHLNSLVLLIALTACGREPLDLTPTPVSAERRAGVCSVENQSVKYVHDESLPSEGYILTVGRRGIELRWKDGHSRRYGLSTLEQLRRPDGSIPCCRIEDAPHFPFRCFMIDPCRHFISVDETRKLLDAMALCKLNYMHWHLTEDQGWRLEIDSCPRLAEVGAWRDRTMVGHLDEGMSDADIRYDDVPHGGFYSKEEVEEIVVYADSLGIEIIPEIDMPGHIQSALAAYPSLGCTGGPYEVWDRWGISREVLCPGRESTFDFVEAVIAETARMFPGKYIHIGGDEVPVDRWRECPDCQNRIRSLGFCGDAEQQLMSWFIARVCDIVRKYGKTPMIYEEAVMKGGDFPSDDVVIMDAVQGPSKGYASVMSDYEFSYFDYCQGTHKSEPLSIGGWIPPRKLYSYDPYGGVGTEHRDKVLGTVAYLWTEYIADDNYLEYMTFPRMQVFADIAWRGGAVLDWGDFSSKIVRHDYPLMDRLGLKYSRHAESLPRGHLPLVPYPQEVRIGDGVSAAGLSDAVFVRDSSLDGAAYVLDIAADSILVRYGGDEGRSYAHATMSQMPSPLPVCHIVDYPAERHRALMLDCTRKVSVSEVRLILGEMAAYKYNAFVWNPGGLYSEDEMRAVEECASALGLGFSLSDGSGNHEYPHAVPFSMAQGAHERTDPYSVYLSAMYTYSIKARDMTAYVSTATMPTDADLEFMLFPRIAIFAENLWLTAVNRDFGRVMEVIWDREFDKWRALGLNVRDY